MSCWSMPDPPVCGLTLILSLHMMILGLFPMTGNLSPCCPRILPGVYDLRLELRTEVFSHCVYSILIPPVLLSELWGPL